MMQEMQSIRSEKVWILFLVYDSLITKREVIPWIYKT